MATVTTESNLDLDALDADDLTRIGELVEERQRLSPEALVDSKVAAKVEDIESEIRSREQRRELRQLARAEADRRDAEARAEAEERRREAALGEARGLQDVREAHAKRIDQLAARLFEAMSAYCETCAGQQRAFVAAVRGNASWSAEARASRR